MFKTSLVDLMRVTPLGKYTACFAKDLNNYVILCVIHIVMAINHKTIRKYIKCQNAEG